MFNIKVKRIPRQFIVVCLVTIGLVVCLWKFAPSSAFANPLAASSIAQPQNSGNSLNTSSAVTYTTYLPFIRGGLSGMAAKVSQTLITLPQTLEAGIGSFCTWEYCTLGPRLYHEPLANGNILVGWTDSSGNGHVSVISSGSLTQTYNYSALKVRGLTAHSDGKFAILLWDPTAKIMWLSKRNADGSVIWTTNIDDPLTSYNGSWVGDSRLTYGNGLYAAYFGVHCDSGWCAGHEGDQLTYVNDSGVIQSGGWQWGCSHSMAELVNYHPTFAKFVAICTTDAYPTKGVVLNSNGTQMVYLGDGNGGGMTSSQLGQVAQSDISWKLVFNAINRPGFLGRGVGFATINSSFASSYIWLTNTTGDYERDPSIARLGTTLATHRYLVGWKTINDNVYRLGVIDDNGNFLVGPDEVSTTGIKWGNRDDSFRTAADGTVTWVQGNANSATLYLFRFNGASFVP